MKIQFTKTDKVITIILLAIIFTFSLDLLNYKDWFRFTLGWLIIVSIIVSIFCIIKSFFKPKI